MKRKLRQENLTEKDNFDTRVDFKLLKPLYLVVLVSIYERINSIYST